MRFMPDRTVEIFRELAALEPVEMSSKAKEEGPEVSSENTSVVVSPEYAARLRRYMRICTLRGRIADAAMEFYRADKDPDVADEEYVRTFDKFRAACRELAALESETGGRGD